MQTPLRRGQILGRHYEILEQIGAGGQSEVYRGRDLSGGTGVAIKIMKQQVADDPIARERMSREASALMNLSRTPAALQLLGQYWTDDGRLVLITELLEGESLEEHLKNLPGQRLAVAEVLRRFPPIVETLTDAHKKGVVHRDLKPANIFLTDQSPGVRLLDFGYAKFMRLRSFTEAGMVAGSPSYISPEGWNGYQDLDQRADVYSLGALIFRCLAGRCPFESDSLVGLLQLVTRAPRPPLTSEDPALPKDLDDWVQLALAIDRRERFQNVAALWRAFTQATHFQPAP